MVHEAKSGESLGIDSMIYRRKEARAKLKSKVQWMDSNLCAVTWVIHFRAFVIWSPGLQRKKVKQGKTSSSKAPVTGDTHPSLAQSMGQLDFLNLPRSESSP